MPKGYKFKSSTPNPKPHVLLNCRKWLVGNYYVLKPITNILKFCGIHLLRSTPYEASKSIGKLFNRNLKNTGEHEENVNEINC